MSAMADPLSQCADLVVRDKAVISSFAVPVNFSHCRLSHPKIEPFGQNRPWLLPHTKVESATEL